ncbi:septal ring lytic transglycosylase RlpA family protein [Helicobacter sp. 23-1044]
MKVSMKILGVILVATFIAGCANTSTYRGGIGAYQSYDGFDEYINRHKEGNKNRTNSTEGKARVESEIPPPENIKFGSARDSDAIQRATMKPYQINGKWYYPQRVQIGENWDGIASWYGPNFHNKKTSNGEIYNMNLHTAAHKTLPMNTIVKVYSLDSGRTTIVRINDRGPFVEGRIIDLSKVAAQDIDMIKTGTARVNIEVIGFGGIVSNDAASNSTIIKDMVNSSEFKDEFKTGESEKVITGGIFSVQIGAFRKRAGAETYQNTHNYDNYRTIIKEGEFEGATIYRVFISGFKSEAEARDFIKAQKVEGFFVRD